MPGVAGTVGVGRIIIVPGIYLCLRNKVSADRTLVGDGGKLAWIATDTIGLLVKGTSDVDYNLAAVTDETSCKTGSFCVDDAKVSEGTLYAYYPWHKYNDPELPENTSDGGLQLSEKSMWVIIPQYQRQSVANAREVGNYFTMVSAPVEKKADTKLKLEFSPLASVICLDIYDTTSEFVSEKVKNVVVTSMDDAGDPLVGGFKYDLTNGHIDPSAGLKRMAAIVEMGTPFTVPSAAGEGRIYMAVMPGTHQFKIAVNTDKGTHVFSLSSSETSTVAKIGTIKLNLGKGAVMHYVLYQPFDLMVWGGDMMYTGNMGWGPHYESGKTTGFSSTVNDHGDEPFFFPMGALSNDGCPALNSVHPLMIASRNLKGWEFVRCYERPSYMKCGTTSAGYSITTPALAGLKEDGEYVIFSFDAARRQGTTDPTVVSVVGPGLIDNVNASVEINPTTPASEAAIRENVEHFEFKVYGAKNTTRLKVASKNKTPKAARIQFDNFIVARPEERVPLPPVDEKSIVRIQDGNTFTITWDEVAHASCYSYVAIVEGSMVYSGIATTPIMKITVQPGHTYEISITAIPDDETYEDSVPVVTYVGIDNHELGFVFLEESFSWLNADFNSAWSSGTDSDIRLLDNPGETDRSITAWGFSTPNTNTVEGVANRMYARLGYLKFGRSKNAGGCNGELFLPATLLSSIPMGSSVDVTLTVDTAMYHSAGGTVDGGKEICVQAITDGVEGEIYPYKITTSGYDYKDVEWDHGMSVTLKNLRADSKIHIFTRLGTANTSCRVYLDNLKVVKAAAE